MYIGSLFEMMTFEKIKLNFKTKITSDLLLTTEFQRKVSISLVFEYKLLLAHFMKP